MKQPSTRTKATRVLAILLSVLLCAGMLPAAAFADGADVYTPIDPHEPGTIIVHTVDDEDPANIVVEIGDPNRPRPEEMYDGEEEEPEQQAPVYDPSALQIQVVVNNPNINIVVRNEFLRGEWWGKAWAGTGTKSDPFLIEDAGNLMRLTYSIQQGNRYGGCYFKMTADIDISEFCVEAVYPWKPIGSLQDPFFGNFDGDGHTVSGLKITGDESYVGLFGENRGTIQNLNVVGEVSGRSFVGGVCGANMWIISNCTFRSTETITTVEPQPGSESTEPQTSVTYGTVKGSGEFIGGVVGYNQGFLTGCTNYGVVENGGEQIGGVCGRNHSGYLTGCVNEGQVGSSKNSGKWVGGVCGIHAGGTFRNNQNFGDVYGNTCVGGVIGQSSATASNLLNYGNVYGVNIIGGISGDVYEPMSHCDNYGRVVGEDSVGGITGWLKRSEISSCDNVGDISGYSKVPGTSINLAKPGAKDAGGIVGYNSSGTILNCSNSGSVSAFMGIEDAGGIAGSSIFGTVSHCVNTGAVSGRERVGGIVGDQNNGIVEYCRNSGDTSSWSDAGGITGFLGYGTIKRCMNSGTVTGSQVDSPYIQSSTGDDSVGGIAGTVVFNATIEDSLNIASVSGDGGVGGIAGRFYESRSYHNYNTGIINGNYLLGCIIGQWYGDLEESDLVRNYYFRYDDDMTGIGRYDEWEYASREVKGLTEGEYKGGQTSTAYVDWDFDEVWHTTYSGPRLNELGITPTKGEVVIESASDVRHLIARVAAGDTYAGCTVRLEADLDLSGLPCIGTKDGNPDTAFAGVFDGSGHTITKNNSEYDPDDDDSLLLDSLFGTVTGTVKNLKVIGSVRGGNDGAGGIVKILDGGTLENCSFVGYVRGHNGVGGLVGGLENNGVICDCVFSGSVYGTGGEDVGGLVGVLYGGTVTRCSMNGTVEAFGEKIGGLAGEMISGSLQNCVHIGAVNGLVEDKDSGDTLPGYKVGGLVGSYKAGKLKDCFHFGGNVSGFLNVGGVLGEQNTLPDIGLSNVQGCFYQSGVLTYADGMNEGHDDLGVGRDPVSMGVYEPDPAGRITPVSAADFKLEQSFSGWDFENDWIMTADCPAIRDLGVTVSFRPNGGSGTMPLVVLPPYGAQLPKCTFTREGYTFIGWNTNTDASGEGFEDEETLEGTRVLLLYPVWAETEDVDYIDETGASQTALNCNILRSDIGTMLSGWYAADGTILMQKRMDIRGDVHLILKNGAELDAQLGIHVPEGSSLTVYGQSGSYYVPGTDAITQGTGRLNANNLTEVYGSQYSDHAAIGGNTGEKAGDIVLCGGVIDAGAENGAAIGGAFGQGSGTVSVYRACVYARGGNGSSGIGAGAFGKGAALELNGGYTWAAGSTRAYSDGARCASPGIGNGVPEQIDQGYEIVNDVTVSINNAYLHAEAGTVDGENDVSAYAIGADCRSNYNPTLIYPLIHVQAKNNKGVPVDWGGIPLFCLNQSVDITPCTVHRGCDDDLNRCRWCGSSAEADIRFVTFDYNLENNGSMPKSFSYGVEPGGAMKVTSNLITPEGLAFLGWNTKADGTGTACIPGEIITPTGNLTLYAQWGTQTETSYIDRGVSKTVQAVRMHSDMRTIYDGWYVAEDNVNLGWMLHVEGDVKIILKDGCTLNANRGIIVPKGSHLSIYGQSSVYEVPGENGITTQGTGVLNATYYNNNAAIGGPNGEDSGSIDIYGGVINATGHTGAAIGGGNGAVGSGGSSGVISIIDGCINASSDYGAAAIGGGLRGSASAIVISGGYINAEAGIYYNKCAPAIGAGVPGDTPVSGGRILLLGGTVIAKTANPPAGFAGAQAIGINLDDAGTTASNYYLSPGASFLAYSAADAAAPVGSADILSACQGRYVRLERCSTHYGSGNTCQYCGADFSNELGLPGSGDEQNPYRLGSQTDWSELARYIEHGGVTSGKYFTQTVGFTVPAPLGTSQNPFRGTFDTAGSYTLFYNAGGGAPFAYAEDATFKNMRVSGTIDADEPYAAGLISHAAGTCLIENCCSAVTVNSAVNGAGYHGGLIAECASGSNVTITGSLFNGQLSGDVTTNCGGFVGKADGSTLTIQNSLMAAETFGPTGSQNFVNGSAELTLTSCYFLSVTADNSSQGARAYIISGDGLQLARVSGGGFGWNNLLGSAFSGKLFGGEGDQIVFTSSLGYDPLYCADAPITQSGSRFTLTVPAKDITIQNAQQLWFPITRATYLEGGIVASNYYNGTWPGNVVKVSAEPYKAYVLGSVTVTDSQGRELALTPNEDGDFTFTMPGDSVNVTASFLKKYEYNENTGELKLLRGTFSEDEEDRWVRNDFSINLVRSVTAEPGVSFTGDCSQFFYGFSGCVSFDLHNVDTSGLTSVKQMFKDCTSLTSISFDGWNDAQITDASGLLEGCSALTSADLSGLSLRRAAVDGLFAGANALSEVTVAGGMRITDEMQLNNNGGGWVTDGTRMILCADDEYATLIGYADEGDLYRWASVALGERYSFDAGTGTLTLNWGDFSADNKWDENVVDKYDVTKVTANDGVRFVGDCSDLFRLFQSCTSMDLSSVDTSEMTNMSGMFAFCRALTSLDLTSWNTSAVTDMSQAFSYCDQLASLDISGWNTSAVTSMTEMFAGCTILETLDLTGWDTSRAAEPQADPYDPDVLVPVGIEWMFSGADALKYLTISPTMSVISEMGLNPGDPSDEGWIVRFDDTNTVVSGSGSSAVIAAPANTQTFVWKTRTEPVPEFRSHTLLLSGQIGVNFYMDLSMLPMADRRSAVMEFTVNGQTTTDSFDESFTNPSTHEYYGFTCYINSVQMNDQITAVLKYGGGGEVSQTYSAADYVDFINTNSGSYSSSTVALVESIADYGHYIQPFLAGNNSWTVGSEHAEMAGSSTLTDSDVQAVKAAVADKAVVRSPGESAVEAVSFSLNLETETAIRIYLRMRDGYTGPVTATVDGKAAACELQSDGRYRIEIGGISAHKLGDTYTVAVSAGGEFTISVSALSYVNTVLNSTAEVFNNDTAHYAVTALYRYYAATVAYQSSLNN